MFTYMTEKTARKLGKDLEHNPYLTVKDIRRSPYMPKGKVAIVIVDDYQHFEYVCTTEEDMTRVRQEHDNARLARAIFGDNKDH